MFKRNIEFVFGTACYLGIAGGLCAISFLGEFVVPVSITTAPQWPLMHASVVEVIVPPANAAAKE